MISSLFVDLNGQVGADAGAAHARYAAAFGGVFGRVIAGLGELVGLLNALFRADLYAKVTALAPVYVNFHFWHRTSGFLSCGGLVRRVGLGVEEGFLSSCRGSRALREH
jgi:hypothetical protein